MDGWVILHFKDGCLRTKITLKQDALSSSSGRSILTDHAKCAKGKKHIAIVDKRKSFFKPKLKPFTEESTESTGETIFSNEQSQKTLEMHFHNVVCINSEIIWTLKSALGLFSVRANDEQMNTLSNVSREQNCTKF